MSKGEMGGCTAQAASGGGNSTRPWEFTDTLPLASTKPPLCLSLRLECFFLLPSRAPFGKLNPSSCIWGVKGSAFKGLSFSSLSFPVCKMEC